MSYEYCRCKCKSLSTSNPLNIVLDNSCQIIFEPLYTWRASFIFGCNRKLTYINITIRLVSIHSTFLGVFLPMETVYRVHSYHWNIQLDRFNTDPLPICSLCQPNTHHLVVCPSLYCLYIRRWRVVSSSRSSISCAKRLRHLLDIYPWWCWPRGI